MIEPFASPAAWFLWQDIPHPREPLWKEAAKAAVEGFNLSCVEWSDIIIEAKNLSYFSSYQTLTTNKYWQSK
jgi:hypothetical protein